MCKICSVFNARRSCVVIGRLRQTHRQTYRQNDCLLSFFFFDCLFLCKSPSGTALITRQARFGWSSLAHRIHHQTKTSATVMYAQLYAVTTQQTGICGCYKQFPRRSIIHESFSEIQLLKITSEDWTSACTCVMCPRSYLLSFARPTMPQH